MKLNKVFMAVFVGVFLVVALSSGVLADYKFQNTSGTDVVTINSSSGDVSSVGFFRGLFDWVIGASSTGYLSFNGSTLDFNETQVNLTIDSRGEINNWSSVYNVTYAGAVNNASYLSTFNASYDTFAYNQTTPAISYTDQQIIANESRFLSTFNTTYAGLINNASYLSTFNSTYDTFAYNHTFEAIDSINSSFLRSDGDDATGTYNFNSGWENGGLTIEDGDLLAQTLYVYNVTSLGVNTLDINGSLMPQGNFNNTFDIGNETLMWKSGYFGTDVLIGSESVKQWLYNQTTPAISYTDEQIIANESRFLSTFNSTYAGAVNNASYLSTFNATYDTFAYNQTTPALSYTDEQILANESRFLSTFNSTYDAKNSSEWINNGSGSIYYNEGNVGIGTSSPSATLEVKRSSNGNIFELSNSADNTVAAIYNDGATGVGLNLRNSSGSVKVALDARSGVNSYINNGGNVGIGTSSPDALFEIEADQDEANYIYLTGHDGNLGGTRPVIKFQRSRGTQASPSVVSSGDSVGSILGTGYDGSSYVINTGIDFLVDGTPGPGDMPGRIEFQTTPDGSSSRQTRMTIDHDGNVGIGTNSPSKKLQVSTSNGDFAFGDDGGSDKTMYIEDSLGNLDRVLLRQSSDKLYFGDIDDNGGDLTLRAGGSDAITMKSNGNVGIGTSSPDKFVDIQKSGGGQSLRIMHKEQFHGVIISPWGSSTNAVNFDPTEAAGEFYFGRDETLSRFIIQSGSVGINEVNPRDKLHVTRGDSGSGNWAENVAQFEDDDRARIGFVSNSTGLGGIMWGDPQDEFVSAIDYLHDVDAMRFYSNNAERMRIDSSGNVGIGTSSPSYDLDVNGSIFVGGNNLTFPDTHSSNKIIMWSTAPDAHNIGTEAFHNVYGASSNYSNSVGHKFYRGGGELIAQIGFGGSGTPTNRLDSYFNGNVGIGTNSPSAGFKSTVKAESSGSDYFDLRNNNGQTTIGLGNDAGNSGFIYMKDVLGTTNIVLNAGDGDDNYFNTGGNFGIGTNSPSDRLDLGDSAGDLRIYDGGGTAHVLGDEDSAETNGIVLRTLTNPGAGEPIFAVESSGNSQRLRVEHLGYTSTTNDLAVEGTGDSYVLGDLGVGTSSPNSGVRLHADTGGSKEQAIRGSASNAAGGLNTGVYGVTSGSATTNTGVYGVASGASNSRGVFGQEKDTDGTGAYGILGYHDGGVGYGGYFEDNDADYAIWANGFTRVSGILRATNYQSGDGTQGMTTTTGYGDCDLTFKDGLLVATGSGCK